MGSSRDLAYPQEIILRQLRLTISIAPDLLTTILRFGNVFVVNVACCCLLQLPTPVAAAAALVAVGYRTELEYLLLLRAKKIIQSQRKSRLATHHHKRPLLHSLPSLEFVVVVLPKLVAAVTSPEHEKRL